jgi:hypothetical protein
MGPIFARAPSAPPRLLAQTGVCRFYPGVVRWDQVNQRTPRNVAIHLQQELAFAGLFNAQVQVKWALPHDPYRMGIGLRFAHTLIGVMQSLLRVVAPTRLALPQGARQRTKRFMNTCQCVRRY